MNRIALGIVSDEVSPDFGEAAHHAAEWGISIFEIRVLKTGRIPAVDQSELREIKTLVKNNGLAVTALSPGIFKLPLSQTAGLEKELSTTLPKTLDLAREFGTSMIIVFGFQREQNESADNFFRATELMARAAEVAQKEGVKLVVENEPGFWCDSGANTAKLIGTVNSPSLRANWDPCNGYGTPETPYPDGYNSVKALIANVHVKDTSEGALIRCVPVGEGAIDWKGQLKAIVRDQIVQHVTIETHCLPLIDKSRQNVITLNNYLAEVYAELEIKT
ncbi:MAG: sugar phosphate isomerase/epimerase [Ignavibacteriales bacterium]|nr:sugar phosphate isomerase/epimerase [Ignavibacteriales bacterium]